MARKLRIEFPDGVYHVLNRGSYRRDLFTQVGEAWAFVKTLEEASEMYGWRIHAYAVMRNHYHVALRTPQPNLTEGMHWLQSTFATRFNRLHGERGHLFQGRYQSLLVEDDATLLRLVNYIHLNPVRAKIVTPEQAAAFRWSSLGRFVRGALLPRWRQGLGYERWAWRKAKTDGRAIWSGFARWRWIQGQAHRVGPRIVAGFGHKTSNLLQPFPSPWLASFESNSPARSTTSSTAATTAVISS
jgi:putative transposase